MRIDTTVWLGWVTLVLVGCTGSEPPASDTGDAPASRTSISTPPMVAAQAGKAPAEPVAVDQTQAAEAARAGQLADARKYLDQARVAAEERRRQAALACDAAAQGDRDACTAVADEALQAELQAARAEFEAQMRQPN